MFTALSPGAIGVRANNLTEAITLARRGGFEGVDFSAHEVADLVEANGAEAVRALFEEGGVRPAGWGLPVDWRGAEERWQKGLDELPRLAKAAAAIGGSRTTTWILPSSSDLPFEDNLAFHIARFTPAARILAENGCSLGLEFIGPKTLRDRQTYPFIYTQAGMLSMARAIGENVGLLLDCWHWYTSHGTLAELSTLTPAEVVYVHVNDAPAGVPIDSQLDNVRALPGETGVIDIGGFLGVLRKIGYDGPVTPEPFKKELDELPDDSARLHAVGDAMRKIMAS